MKHYNITISGKVQGVFFRKYTQEKAQQLSIKGFVRNEPTGDVYCEAEGEEVHTFVQWCHQGSPNAVVTQVKVVEASLKGFTSFEIQRL